MGKFKGVLLATDIDATLLNRQGALSDENREAISYFMQNGGLFTLITGRSRQSFERPRSFLSFNAPAVLSNGSVIYDYASDRLICAHFMDESALEVCEEVVRAFPQVAVESYRLDGVCSFNPNKATLAHFDYVGIRDAVFVRSLRDMPRPWLKALFTQDADYLRGVSEWLSDRYADRFEFVFSNPYLLEMQAAGVNKGSGLLALAKILGIGAEHVFCAGDQENDASMMKVATSFAPENALDEVKDAADYIVSDCDHHAIRDAIGIIDGLYSRRPPVFTDA